MWSKINKRLPVLLAVFLLLTACTVTSTPPNVTPADSSAETRQDHPADDHDHEAENHGDEHGAEEMTAANLNPVALAEGEPLQVVATTSIVGDIAHQIGGSQIDLTTLLPPGADPHTFEPTPRDLAAVADAHLILANGLGLEGFLAEMIANAGGEASLVHVSAGVTPRSFVEKVADDHADEAEGDHQEEEVHQAEHDDDHGPDEAAHDHDHEGVDPHAWTSPANAIIFVDNIERALAALDPANAATYEANAAAYTAELEALDAWVKEQIATIPPQNRKLVTDHTAFGYYADRYGLEQVGAVIPSFSTNAEPSAQALAQLTDAIQDQEVRAVFVGNTVNPTLSEQVARDTGVKLLRLYTGSLEPEGSTVDSYLAYIRYNTETIVEGLR